MLETESFAHGEVLPIPTLLAILYIERESVVDVAHLLFGVVMISATQVNEPADHCRWLAPVHGDSAPPKKLVA